MENLRILKERSDAISPPSDMHDLSASLTSRAIEQKHLLKAAEEDEADAVKFFAVVSSSLTKHAGHIEAYSMMKKTQFEVTNKDRRLRNFISDSINFDTQNHVNLMYKNEHLSDSGRAVKRSCLKVAGY